ncbi:3,4-dihydroxy-2-butanone-4-phosphate synthase [Mycolicibacterium hippocampi]|uniref:3,4-dihydroxy-2-butanone-4-phosphate synthase n=1 Tax=Mycolicibacterium hippocampi TaxID=659824 RepID=UPI003512247A
MRTTDIRVRRAINAVAEGRPVVVIADTECGSEGHLVFAADAATPAVLAFTVRHTSGLVRAALPRSVCERLDLPPMCASDPDRPDASAQRVAVDVSGTGTGISATDRARTIAALASADARPGDFSRPGHVIPVQADADGLLGSPGVAEAAIDLARLAGRRPAAGLCEIVSRDHPTTIASGAESIAFAAEHGLAVVSLAELLGYRRRTERQIVRLAETTLPTGRGIHRVIGFRDVHGGAEHLVLLIGSVGSGEPVPLHVHRECLTGDVFGSTTCHCGAELDDAVATMSAQGGGVIVYLRPTGSLHACGLAEPDVSGAEPATDTLTWILWDLGVYSVRLADDAPGYGLVMFGAIRESRLAA